MKIDSVLDAKASIFQKAFGYTEVLNAQLSENGGAAFSPEQGSEAFAAIADAKRRGKRNARELIAIGFMNSPKPGNEVKLAILVQRKRLVQHPIVERAVRLAGGEVSIIVTGPAVRHGACNGGRHRPLRIGSSIGHYRVTAGTLGCFVKCTMAGEIGILSNNHVLANANKAKLDDPIIQPGRADGGEIPRDRVATLKRFIPLDFTQDSINHVDCAFATLDADIDHAPSEVVTRDGAPWPIGAPKDLLLPERGLKKMGRTTDHTTGNTAIIGVDNVFVSMVTGNPNMLARFDNQIAIHGEERPFSKPGDSGALVFTRDDRPVGLLFAGTQTGGAGFGVTFANPLGTVLELLDLELI